MITFTTSNVNQSLGLYHSLIGIISCALLLNVDNTYVWCEKTIYLVLLMQILHLCTGCIAAFVFFYIHNTKRIPNKCITIEYLLISIINVLSLYIFFNISDICVEILTVKYYGILIIIWYEAIITFLTVLIILILICVLLYIYVNYRSIQISL